MRSLNNGVVTALFSKLYLVSLDMKIQYSALVGSTSGKLNGSVASHNKGGAYFRNKGVVSNPQTAGQMSIRARMGGFSSAWKGLTQGQRDLWNAEAPNWPYQDKLQQTRIPSGFQLFTQLNTVLSGISLTVLTSPPAKADIPGISMLQMTLRIDNDPTPGVQVFTAELMFNNETTDANYGVQVAFTPGMSPGVSNPGTAYRVLSNYVPVPAATSGTLDLSGSISYSEMFPIVSPGQKVFMRARVIYELTGQVGPWINTSTIVTVVP